MSSFQAYPDPLILTPNITLVPLVAVTDVNAVRATLNSVAKSSGGEPSQGHVCMVNMTHVSGEFHVQNAVRHALEARSSGRSKCFDFESEVCYQMLPSTNITGNIEKNRVAPDSTEVLCVFIDIPITISSCFVQEVTVAGIASCPIPPSAGSGTGTGTSAYLRDRITPSDAERLAKAFKLSSLEVARYPLEDCIVMALAIKGV